MGHGEILVAPSVKRQMRECDEEVTYTGVKNKKKKGYIQYMYSQRSLTVIEC